jgi:hypothetical protein
LYRYFLIDHGLRLPPEEFVAEDYAEARHLAQQFKNGYEIEIWQDDRLVVTLTNASR